MRPAWTRRYVPSPTPGTAAKAAKTPSIALVSSVDFSFISRLIQSRKNSLEPSVPPSDFSRVKLHPEQVSLLDRCHDRAAIVADAGDGRSAGIGKGVTLHEVE